MRKYIFFSLSLFVFHSILSQINLNQNLIAYFPLDGNAMDMSINHLNGTTYNTSVTDGIINNALLFNGNNSKVISSTNNRGINDTLTVSAWFKTNHTNSLPYSFIVAKYNWITDKGFHLAIKNNKIMFAGRNTGGQYIRIDSYRQVTDGKWHFALGRIQGNTWELWVDGVYQGAVSGSAYNPALANSEPLTIGYYNLGDNGNHLYFDGSIDEVRIYNRALNQNEIDYLYSHTLLEINDIEVNNFKIYPNPTKNFINIDNPFNHPISTIKILDISGRIILSFNNNFKKLDVGKLHTGTYILQIVDTNDRIVYNKKIIIIK